jgi:cytochrome c peroxidase
MLHDAIVDAGARHRRPPRDAELPLGRLEQEARPHVSHSKFRCLLARRRPYAGPFQQWSLPVTSSHSELETSQPSKCRVTALLARVVLSRPSMRTTSLLTLLCFTSIIACNVENRSDDVGASESALHSAAPDLRAAPNPYGFAQSATSTNTVDTTNPFFQSLGTNGRSCGTCHLSKEGWTITPPSLERRFAATDGLDPIFARHDAATSPNADVSTVEARRTAFALLLSRGVIRVGLPVKPTSEFRLVAVDDPYGFASASALSLFRRPLPTTNLRFLNVINWDGRSIPAADPTNIRLGLKNQSNGATVNHAKATAPIADDVREAIVSFELDLTTAQVFHLEAGLTFIGGAYGGPWTLLSRPNSKGAFDVFDGWVDEHGWFERGRESVAHGQAIFNARCAGCHDVANAGAGSSIRFFDVGISDASRRTPDLPLYTFENIATGERIQTTDPGRALISGLWVDMNRFKVPGLRGLAARAPYFHNGSARTIQDVVDHYDARLGLSLSAGDKHDLTAFLAAL